MRTAAVTGVGLCSPLARTARATYDALVAGGSAVVRVGDMARGNFDALAKHTAAVAPICYGVDEAWESGPVFAAARDFRRLPRHTQLAFLAAREALADAGLLSAGGAFQGPQREHAAVCIGSGMPSLRQVHDEHARLRAGSRVSPLFIAHVLPGTVSGAVSQALGLSGGVFAPSVACATGLASLSDARRLIQAGDAQIVIAGATDAGIDPFAVASFASTRALLPANLPEKTRRAHRVFSRPFGAERAGFVMAEGAAVLVVEEEQAARARGARIYGRIAGAGHAANAGHLLESADPDDPDADRAPRRAMASASVGLSDIACVFAHATSTVRGDASEARLLSRLGARCAHPAHDGPEPQPQPSLETEAVDSTASGGNRAPSLLLSTDTVYSSRRRDAPETLSEPPPDAGRGMPDASVLSPRCGPVPVTATKGALGHMLGASSAADAVVALLSMRHGVVPPIANYAHDPQVALCSPFFFAASPARLDGRRYALLNAFGFGGAHVSVVLEGC